MIYFSSCEVGHQPLIHLLLLQPLLFILIFALSKCFVESEKEQTGPPEQERCDTDQEKLFCGKDCRAGPDSRGPPIGLHRCRYKRINSLIRKSIVTTGS